MQMHLSATVGRPFACSSPLRQLRTPGSASRTCAIDAAWPQSGLRLTELALARAQDALCHDVVEGEHGLFDGGVLNQAERMGNGAERG